MLKSKNLKDTQLKLYKAVTSYLLSHGSDVWKIKQQKD